MPYFSDNPVLDFERYDRDQERLRELLPVCRKCKCRITDDDYYYIDGVILCEDCMKEKYQRKVEDYIF